jgi:hypothetical protein
MSLPEPIANYFAADAADDASAIAGCFALDGIVRDEGGTFTGREAIKGWNERAKARYHYTVEPLSAVERDGQIVVVGRVAGNFPNSPIRLQHIFRVTGDQIVSLEIR